MADVELKSPRWFANCSTDDFSEPMKYVVNKFKPTKAFAISISLGASVMTQVLSKNEIKLNGAVCLNCPIKMEETCH